MKKLSHFLAFALILTLVCPVLVTGVAGSGAITIDSVKIEEYVDVSGNTDANTFVISVKYTVPQNTESVSLVLLGKNTTDVTEFADRVIYIDQIDGPTGEYSFPIERWRMEEALETTVVEESTLYLKMGATGIDTPALKEFTFNEPSDFAFVGAQIRTEDKQGLRFIFSMPKSDYAKLSHPTSSADTGVGFGTVVFAKQYLGDDSLVKGYSVSSDGATRYSATVPAVVLFGETETHIQYTVCITDIRPEYYTEEYVAVPYKTYVENGEEVTVYGNMTQNVTVYSVAELCYASADTSAEQKEYIYNNILTVVDPKKYPAK